MRIVGLGAGGLARVVVELIQARGDFELVGLLDVRREIHGTVLLGVPVLGDDALLPRLRQDGVAAAFIGVGSVKSVALRMQLFRSTCAAGFEMPPLVHPRAFVSPSARIGPGSLVLAGATIGTGVTLGANVVVYSGAVIEHDVVVEDHAHIAPGVAIAGVARVGSESFIGIGASIIQAVTIGHAAVVGAGAVVLRDVPARTTVVGIPARPLRTVTPHS